MFDCSLGFSISNGFTRLWMIQTQTPDIHTAQRAPRLILAAIDIGYHEVSVYGRLYHTDG